MLRRRGFTFVEGVVVLVVLGILMAIVMAILFPNIRRRPKPFIITVILPQHFFNTRLQDVFAQLDDAITRARFGSGKKRRPYLSKSVWDRETLKNRRVSFDSAHAKPLKEVLTQLEKSAHIRIGYGGWCGTCGSTIGRIRIVDALAKTRE